MGTLNGKIFLFVSRTFSWAIFLFSQNTVETLYYKPLSWCAQVAINNNFKCRSSSSFSHICCIFDPLASTQRFCLWSQEHIMRMVYSVILAASNSVISFCTFKKHVTFTYHFRSKLITTQASDFLRCSLFKMLKILWIFEQLRVL